MYRSKDEVVKRQKQVEALYQKLQFYKGKVFENLGFDKKTQTYPLHTEIGSFIGHARSIFQYAYKEASERGAKKDYERCVGQHPVIRVFKDLRDVEIHASGLGTRTTLSVKIRVGSPKHHPPEITTAVTKKLEVTPDLINQLQAEGDSDALQAIKDGKDLYEAVSLDGETDFFKLLQVYMAAISEFIKCGIKAGFIT